MIAVANKRISNGEFSERALARQVGISQPQMHNILKGARNLTPETGDLLLAGLKITIWDLLTRAEIALKFGDSDSTGTAVLRKSAGSVFATWKPELLGKTG